ncbi:MAG TPA: DMT family transporter [Dehalococcoidia bacterium]|nr:DMT family transporter [Dehalococcoidia bacterium]
MGRSRAAVVGVLFAGVLAVSAAALFVRLADAPALSTAAYRLLFASVPTIALLPMRGRRELPALHRADWGWLLLSGGCLALHFATWIASLEMTTVSSSVALVTTSPLFVAGVVMLRGERVSRATVLAMLVCLAGGLIIGAADVGGGRALAGDLLALAGAAFAGAYFALGRRLRAVTSVTTYIGTVYPIAAIALTVAALAGRQRLSGFDGQTWLMFVLLALVPQLLGHSSLNWALGYLSAPFVAIAVLGEPVIATVLAALFLGELPGPLRIAGGIVVLAGVYLGLRAELEAAPAGVALAGVEPAPA